MVNNRSKAGKYFRVHGEDELIPKISDFKGKKKEQQERFMMMIVWAYLDLFGKPVPSKEYILNALKRMKMYDGNFSHYFESISKSFFMNIDEGYELNPSGESKVEKFIEDIESNSYEGYVFKYESSKSSNRQARINKDEDNLIEELINSQIDIGTIDVRNLSSITHNAMFAIWSITKGIGKMQAVKIKVAYLYLVRRYETISVKQKGFTDTVIRLNNKNIFKKNADGLYFLTEAAEREVERWISSGVIAKSIDLGGDKSE